MATQQLQTHVEAWTATNSMGKINFEVKERAQLSCKHFYFYAGNVKYQWSGQKREKKGNSTLNKMRTHDLYNSSANKMKRMITSTQETQQKKSITWSSVPSGVQESVSSFLQGKKTYTHTVTQKQTHTQKQEADKTGKDPQTAGSEQTGGKLKLNSQTGSGSGRGAAVVQMAAAIYSQAPPPSHCSSLPPAIVLLYVLFLS